MQHKILLLDELGEKWGQTHVYHNLKTPYDALKLLCINHPDFAQYLLNSSKNGIDYKVTQVNQELTESDLFLPLGKHDLVIAPIITGSGDTFKAIAGVALSIIAPQFAGAFIGTFGLGAGQIAVSTALKSLGAFLLLDGAAGMLSPQLPTSAFDQGLNVGQSGFTGGPSSVEKGADGRQSYAYTGAVNTVGIGKTIPVVYGRALIGGHLISTDIDINSTSDPLTTNFIAPNPSNTRVNGKTIPIVKKGTKDFGTVRATRAKFGKNKNSYGKKKFRLTNNKFSDLEISLGKTSRQKISSVFDIQGSGTMNNQFMHLMIDFKGLFDHVSKNGSFTRIHGFITFNVIIVEPDTESTVLNQQITVSSLMNKNQRYRIIFNFEPVNIPEKNAYDVFIQIADKEFFSTGFTKMTIQRLGYRFFGGKR